MFFIKKSNLHYICVITPKRVTSGDELSDADRNVGKPGIPTSGEAWNTNKWGSLEYQQVGKPGIPTSGEAWNTNKWGSLEYQQVGKPGIPTSGEAWNTNKWGSQEYQLLRSAFDPTQSRIPSQLLHTHTLSRALEGGG